MKHPGLKKGEMLVRVADDVFLKVFVGDDPFRKEYVEDVEHFGWGIRGAGFESESICRALLGVSLNDKPDNPD